MASKNPEVRAIELEASKRAAADGKTSKAERFAIRNELRAAQGMKAEQRKRGGAAGVWDRNKQFAPALGLLAAPFALPALGGLLGIGGAGAAGAGAAGAAAASPLSLGGIASTIGKVAGSPITRNVVAGLQGLNAANQRKKADQTMQAQLDRENALFQQAAPLRLSGTQGMLAPTLPDLSGLADAQRRASNFAGNLASPLPMGGR